MGRIDIVELTKTFADGTVAVDRLSLEIRDGEFMVLVGPSGCGKTTLLRMIAGIEEATAGAILIGDRDVTHLPPRARDVAMVFQNYALYPHLAVRDNLGFALKLQKVPKADARGRVARVAGTLGLDALLDRKPAALSGGQRQRVAMGRAIVREPQAFLMDEPLSNLDAKLRVSMRAELARLHERLGTTTVYVTHDQIEAMTLGQRVAVLREGILQQCDTPTALYRRPVNLFVAAFIGSPPMNLVEAELADGAARFGGYALALPETSPLHDQRRRVLLGIRPEAFEPASPATDPALPRVRVLPEIVEELGAENYVLFPIDAPRVDAESVRAAADAADDDGVLLADDRRSLFTARVDGRHSVTPGAALELVVDTSRLHFFDLDSGAALTEAAA